MKTAILITARLKSTRLPMKVLMPIEGKPMICHLLDRLKTARRPERIIICTSPVVQDMPLIDVAKREGVEYFLGDPDDVLLRLTGAAEAFGVDTVISCTADNPFVDPVYIDKLVDFHLVEKNDYSRVDGLPFGTFSYALSRAAMVHACEIKDEVDTEVWGGYFTQTGLFRCGVMSVTDPSVRRPDLRLTVDEPADFELVKKIFARLYGGGRIFGLDEIVRLMDDEPALKTINAGVVESRQGDQGEEWRARLNASGVYHQADFDHNGFVGRAET